MSPKHDESHEPQRAFTRRIDCGARDSLASPGERRDPASRGRAATPRQHDDEGRHR